MEVPRSIVNPPDVKSLRRKARTGGMARVHRHIGTRPLATINVAVPECVMLRGDVLVWQQSGDRLAETVEGMLDAFIAIETESDILRFAERFGVLFLCKEHLRPSTHWPEFPMPYDDCEPERVDGWSREPLAKWFEYVSRARGILNVAAMLHHDEQPTEEDWCRAAGHGPIVPEDYGETVREYIVRWPPVEQSLTEARWELCRLVDEWISMGSVAPALWWIKRDDAFLIFSPLTVGVLALQLATAVTGRHRLAICMACGMIYAPTRKPASGSRNYCVDCGDGVASKIRHQERAAKIANVKKKALVLTRPRNHAVDR
jgi:hypothetical protein